MACVRASVYSAKALIGSIGNHAILSSLVSGLRSPLLAVCESLHTRGFRTHTCDYPRPEHAGLQVDLSGWVHSVRVMGDSLVFFALRDAYGITQVVIDAGPVSERDAWQVRMLEIAQGVRPETVVQVTGVIRRRPDALVNVRMATGHVEVVAAGLRVLSSPGHALPFLPGAMTHRGADGVSEDVRLAARYVDLRRDVMQRNLRLRSMISNSIRSYLLTLQPTPFIEVETPLLVRSSPEGAREFLVPTRRKGRWYALAQSPQQWKQMLMVGGVDRYFQIARCFRDESGRADRQPEFTQVDMEMAFATATHVQEVVEGMVRASMQAASGNTAPPLSLSALSPPLISWRVPSSPFARLSYVHCMCVYGSDKPDRRVGMPLYDVSGQALDWDAAHPALRDLHPFLIALRSAASSAHAHARYSARGSIAFHVDTADTDLSLLAAQAWTLRAFVAPGLGSSLTRSEGEAVLAELRAASNVGDSGLLFARVSQDGGGLAPWIKDSVLAKGLSKEQQASLIQSVGGQAGDMVVLSWGAGVSGATRAGTARLVMAQVMRMVGLGKRIVPHGTDVRLEEEDTLNQVLGSSLASALPGRKEVKPLALSRVPSSPGQGETQGPSLDMFWVTGFPMFEQGADGALAAVHHPFTAPVPEDAPALITAANKSDTATLLGLRAVAYDLVANGVELGGGSVRMHDVSTQRTVIEKALGLSPAEKHGFGALLSALDSGAPPHAGLALGLDRWVSMLAGPAAATSVRDVIAFPKSATGADLITGAPAQPTAEQLQEYHVSIDMKMA